MIYRNIFITIEDKTYGIVFDSEVGSIFLRIKVVELGKGEPQAIMSATVKWDNYKSLKYYGTGKVKYLGAILGTIERELANLGTGSPMVSKTVLH